MLSAWHLSLSVCLAMFCKVAMMLVGCSFTLLIFAPTASAVCCHPDFFTSTCPGGSKPKEFYCGAVGFGGCNLFGCNCEGGCRSKKRMGRSAEDNLTGGAKTGWDVVRDADTDGNGALDDVEIVLYFHRQGRKVEGRDWLVLDVNLDKQLTGSEIDSDLELMT